jgi:myo-inositol-1(or 4)-monophosphatase
VAERSELLRVALGAARAAVAVHREHLGTVGVERWGLKGAADFVTHVDRSAEARIVEQIRAAFPDHHVLAEEEASDRGHAGAVAWSDDASWTWIVDPLDGTTNYLHGYPEYAVSIAAARHGVLDAAVVINGATGAEFKAVRGGGAYLNGVRLHVSEITSLPRSLIGTGFPFKALDRLPEYSRQLEAALRATSGVRRAGSAALDLCHVAAGWFDGFWELTLAPWDVAAGTLIVREAGGVVTRLDGDPDVLGHGSILAGNPAIHAALGELLGQVEARDVAVAGLSSEA